MKYETGPSFPEACASGPSVRVLHWCVTQKSKRLLCLRVRNEWFSHRPCHEVAVSHEALTEQDDFFQMCLLVMTGTRSLAVDWGPLCLFHTHVSTDGFHVNTAWQLSFPWVSIQKQPDGYCLGSSALSPCDTLQVTQTGHDCVRWQRHEDYEGGTQMVWGASFL